MKNSRKQIMKQIAQMDKNLHEKTSKLIEHQEYLVQSAVIRYHVPYMVLVASAVFIGWQLARKQWLKKVMHHAVEIGALASLNSFKKTMSSYLTDAGSASIHRIINNSLKN
jgi:hypothetical protein